MQPVVSALHPGGGGVGDTLPGVLPAHPVAPPLHFPDELLPAAGQLHDRLHGGDEPELPALPPHCGPILSGAEPLGAPVLLIRLEGGQTVLQAELVADRPHLLQRPGRKVELLPCVRVDGVDHEVGVWTCSWGEKDWT